MPIDDDKDKFVPDDDFVPDQKKPDPNDPLVTGKGMEHPNAPAPTLNAGASQFSHTMPGSFEGHPENVGEYPASVGRHIGSGVSNLAQGNFAKGGHELISGAGEAALPLAPFAAAGAPLATALGAGGGYVGSKAGHGIAENLGATPDQADLAGDVGGLAGGLFGAKIASPIKSAAGSGIQRLTRGPGGYQDATVNPATMATRELEAAVPRNPDPAKVAQDALEGQKEQAAAHAEMEGDIAKGRQQRIAAHSEMEGDLAKRQAAVEAEQHGLFEDRLAETERARQKELGDFGRLRTMDSRFYEGGAGPSNSLASSPNAPSRYSLSPGLMQEGTPNSGVQIVPEPRPLFPGEDPNYMASIERTDELPELAGRAKPGAGKQLQQLGRPIIYRPRPTIGQR